MNILHITDFHWKSSNPDAFKQQRIVDDIIDHILGTGTKIDFIFFTGDLVNSGSKMEDFTRAKQVLIDELLNKLKLPIDRFFMCQGNHDIDRNSVSPAIISRIDSFKNNKELEGFAKKSKDLDLDNSYLPLKNYDLFSASIFKKGQNDVIEKSYTTHIREFEGKKIGIFCANTAWRSVGINDDGNLIIPISHIESGLHNLKACDIKILIHHHPLWQFRQYNQYELEDIIHNNFNIAFSGHLHKSNTSITYTNKDGILKLASGATLAESDGSSIGFTVLNLDLDTLLVKGECFKYDRQGEFFYSSRPFQLQVPISHEKEKQNKFRKRLRNLYENELEDADDLFLNGKVNKDNKGFKELWTNPVISSKSPEEVKKNGSFAIVTYEELAKSYSNYLILGDDKCGKTSLLKKIQLECLSNYNTHEKIPIYIDAKKIDKGSFSVSKFQRDIATYFSINRADSKDIMDNQIVVLLIDNMDFRQQEDISWLQAMVQCFSLVQIIICTDQNSGSKYQDLSIGSSTVKNIYFHNLKRKQLRELADKFYGASDSKVEVLARINYIFSMLAIPFNFWSVSLFMWVFKDTNRDITNDVDLIDLYIESILEREKLTKSKSGFSYDKYKQYLAHLSRELLSFNQTNYSGTYDQLYNFTKEYLEENPRNNIDAQSILEYILNKGIVKDVGDGHFTFRLNGVFEYFLAHYLKIDSKFRNEIINDDNVYLSFKNELEMYAGSNRGDEDFVAKIYAKTKGIFKKANNNLPGSSIDEVLRAISTDDIALQLEKSQTDLLRQSLTQEEVDSIEDSSDISNLNLEENCEVKLKRHIPIDDDNVVSLEKSLYLLGRVFKNADDIKNTELIHEIFDYLVSTTVSWGYKLFNSFSPDNVEETEDKGHSETLIKLMRQMLPIIVQSRLSDMVGADNMQAIIKKKIESLKVDLKNQQFKYFILVYTLAEIDLPNNYIFIKDSIEKINIPILRYAILMKILYYYCFRLVEFNPQTRDSVGNKLKDYYVIAGGKFNSKLYGKDQVTRAFQSFDKMNAINKRRMLN